MIQTLQCFSVHFLSETYLIYLLLWLISLPPHQKHKLFKSVECTKNNKLTDLSVISFHNSPDEVGGRVALRLARQLRLLLLSLPLGAAAAAAAPAMISFRCYDDSFLDVTSPDDSSPGVIK
jgi:hypothetical protein